MLNFINCCYIIIINGSELKSQQRNLTNDLPMEVKLASLYKNILFSKWNLQN